MKKKTMRETWDPKDVFFKCKPQELEMAKKFVDCAIEDREACILLYVNGICSKAVFHLEQSVEMSIKADMLLSGSYDLDDIKSFSHNVMGAVRNFKKRMGDHFRWGNNTGIDKLYDAIYKNNDLVLTASGSKLIQIFEDAYLKDNPYRTSLLSKGLGEDEIKQSWMGYFGINILAIVVHFHEQTTRYPDDPKKRLYPSNYKVGMGIVDALPFFIGELDDLIDFLQWNIKDQEQQIAATTKNP